MGPTDDDDGKYEGLILAMLRNRGNVAKAAAAAGVPRSTAFRWVKTPAFKAAYLLARREAFDEALAALQVEAVDAVAALKREFSDDRTEVPTVVSAAKAFIGLGLRAYDQMLVKQELDAALARVDEMIAANRAPPAPAAQEERVTTMTDGDLAEAVALRASWLAAIGHPPDDIAASLRFNPPQNAADERELLAVVNRVAEHERAGAEDLNAA